ncbi:MAG TPA: glycolate oxidase subunit GlcF [Azospirillaceae bacterium]|nr:glycolate oxidase subunit GlcF [Azospirillaceae bacterium]
MRTDFTLAQLADPAIAEADHILRACVHCGFCTATCPTYQLTGDELDGPRGRIYLIKDMLEGDKPASATVAKHLDRCLTCLSCMTTCPSGVHYAHLADIARQRIERTHRRPWAERMQRRLLASVLPRPRRFRLALVGAALARPFKALMPKRLRVMLDMAPGLPRRRGRTGRPGVFRPEGAPVKRVALLSGCVQPNLRPEIDRAAVSLLNRHGVEVVIARKAGCCGALTQHMGMEEPAKAAARANILAWSRLVEEGGLDAVVVTASGCGTQVKDYGHLFRGDPDMAEKAARIAALARDVTEVLAELPPLPPAASKLPPGLRVAYHAACSLQHGQRVREAPKRLLAQAGFTVLDVPDAHLCCGSAGTYNILQPEMAGALRDRKVRAIEGTKPRVVAAGNIGCLTQIASGTGLPVVHTVELLEWAAGGRNPLAG